MEIKDDNFVGLSCVRMNGKGQEETWDGKFSENIAVLL